METFAEINGIKMIEYQTLLIAWEYSKYRNHLNGGTL